MKSTMEIGSIMIRMGWGNMCMLSGSNMKDNGRKGKKVEMES
jgi:hypothetical protein